MADQFDPHGYQRLSDEVVRLGAALVQADSDNASMRQQAENGRLGLEQRAQERQNAMDQQFTQAAQEIAQLRTSLASAPPTVIVQTPPSVDMKSLGKPSVFGGEEEKWRDFSLVFGAHAVAAFPEMERYLTEYVEAAAAPVLRDPKESELAKQLYLMLVLISRNPALTIVQNSGGASKNGFLAWRALHYKFEPNQKSRHASMLMGLMNYDFSGNLLEKIESFEREVARYEVQSKEVFPENIQIGVVSSRCVDKDMRKHLIFHASRLDRWVDFKNEVVNVQTSFSGYQGQQAMDLGAFEKSQARCWTCGTIGHLSSECNKKGKKAGKGKADGKKWTPQVAWSYNKDKGKGGGKPGGRGGKPGSGKGKSARFDGKCHRCGKPGHRSKDCRSVLHSIEEYHDDWAWNQDWSETPALENASTIAPSASVSQIAPSSATTASGQPLQTGCLWIATLSLNGDDCRQLMAISDAKHIVFGVDSGAAATVIPKDCAPDVELQPGDNVSFLAADGSVISELGKKSLVGKMTGDQELRGIRAKVAPVHKALLSVADMVDQGHRVVFDSEDDGGSFAVHKATGHSTRFDRRRNVYEVDFFLDAAASGSDFTGPARQL